MYNIYIEIRTTQTKSKEMVKMLGYEYSIYDMIDNQEEQERYYEEYMIEQASKPMTDEELMEMYEYFKSYMEV